MLRWAYQLAVVGAVGALIAWLASNVVANSSRQGIPTGFGYLDQPSQLTIPGNALRSTQPVRDALWQGTLNTLRVVVVGLVLATLIGVVVGVARLSGNWLVRKAAMIYVEAIRNIPLLAVIVFTYLALVLTALPRLEDAWEPLGLAVISNRGAVLPWFNGLPAVDGREVSGGITLAPEYLALLLALVVYTASHIAEIVRGSVQAVPRGQDEAARALGLGARQRLWYVVLPQAMRIAVPPMGNQYLNLLKNSSLGLVISYFELTKVTTVSIANSSPAVPSFLLLMAIYLAFSLVLSGVVNVANRRLALVER